MKVEHNWVMLWDCPYCKNKGNLGFIYDCPGCGRCRPRGITFYDPEVPREATEAEMKLMGGQDPNWYCEHCDSGNKHGNENCWKCSAPKGSSPDHATQLFDENGKPIDREDTGAPDSISMPRRGDIEPGDLPRFVPVPTARRRSEPQNSARPNRNDFGVGNNGPDARGIFDGLGFDIKPVLAVLGGIAALVAIVFLIYQVFFNLHTGTAKITGFNWSRTVRLEEIRTFREEGWSMPIGAREISSQMRQHGTKKVFDHNDTKVVTYDCSYTEPESYPCTKDNGNGSKSSGTCTRSKHVSKTCTKNETVAVYRDEPVYDTWYTYDVDRWTTVISRPTSGTDQKPYYDPIQATSKQRRIEDPGSYVVYFHNDEVGDFNKSYSLSEYLKANPKVSYEIKINYFKTVMKYPSFQ